MDSKCMLVAALGRPLYPGMLYDCRRDFFIPGVTLWDKKALRNDLDVHQHPKTHLKFAASDSFSDKTNLLDISASLKASFLCGLVEVGGSAKYLHDTKSSARQCRVTMQYSQTTKFEELTMQELGHITYPQVFEQKTATHVVTAVEYGAQAFMVFDHTTAENESKQAVEGNLHAVVKKIPTISIEGEASLKMTEGEKKLAEKISVTFYGDLALEQNPTTYKEALEVYKKLPSLMKQQQNESVPLNVWLYPLTLLDDKAAKLVREINMSLMDETEELLEELGEVERRCNDLVKSQITDNFPDVKDRLLKFQALHRNYMTSFKKELSRVLPAIRSGAQEDKALWDILNICYTLPFTTGNMKEWLDEMMNELQILSYYTSGLEAMMVVKSSGSLKSILFDPNVDVLVCLSFTSLKYEDAYLTAIQDFIKNEGLTKLKQTNEKNFCPLATQPWLASRDILERMKQNLSLFTSFSKANQNEKRIKFIITSISDSSNPGNSIRLYQKSLLINAKFQPVSKPPLPVVETSKEKVILKLSKSPTGETVRFRVEYRTKTPTDSAADVDTWKVTDTSDTQSSFTLTGLKPAEQYWVRYRAVSDVGVSEASDSVPFAFHGKLNVTVDQWDFSTLSLFDNLKTKIMAHMGMLRWSPSTIESEVTHVVNHPKIPYTNAIPGGLRAGKALYFQGAVYSAGGSFSLNFKTGPKDEDDFPFHCRMDDCITCDSRRNGNWERQEITPGCPVPIGSAFDIFIVTKTEGYEVYVNGQRTLLFSHRMPVEKVTTLLIQGDVIIDTIGIVANWSTSTFSKELNSGIQSNVLQAVCKPTKQKLGKIPGGLRPGLALFFQGIVLSDCVCFSINLLTGPSVSNDIAFHFTPRMPFVVLNSRRDGGWENEELMPAGPFVKGGAFDIIMVIKLQAYEVIVNGLEFCTFKHRIPVDKVTTLDIWGDVVMNAFSIIEVNDVNLKVTIPANM